MITKDNIYNPQHIREGMVNELISVRVPKPLLQESESIVREEGFSSIQEFMKHILREELLRRRKEQALLDIERLRGSAEQFIVRSKKEVEKHIQKKFS